MTTRMTLTMMLSLLLRMRMPLKTTMRGFTAKSLGFMPELTVIISLSRSTEDTLGLEGWKVLYEATVDESTSENPVLHPSRSGASGALATLLFPSKLWVYRTLLTLSRALVWLSWLG